MRNIERNIPGAFIFTCTLVIFWVVIAFYALLPVLPNNPITVSIKPPVFAQTILPEGWKFYTRDPREHRILLFTQKDGVWINASIGPNASPLNYFGLDRVSRAQGVEYGLLLTSVSPSKWTDCEESIETCLDRIPVAGTIKNISPKPTLLGIIGIAWQEILPWAWRNSANTITMPSKVVKLKVK